MTDSERHRRVRAVFVAVCDLPSEELDDALDRACAGDAELRRDVERLLVRDRQTDDRLEEPPLEGWRGRASAEQLLSPVGAPQPASRPARIGDYDILEELGSGGMGVVYRAHQKNPPRDVALKVMRSVSPREEDRRRFEVELLALGRLHHPCIATVFEGGTFDSGLAVHPYFVMELVDGLPLVDFAFERGLGTRPRVELFQEVCRGVAYAHARGVIHRDLKPANILVGESGLPRIIDFGIARVAGDDGEVALTRTGGVVGTPQYMSPEQASGSRTVDPRTDVYTLGVLLYQLLTGALPYDLTDVPTDRALRIIIHEPVEPAGRHDSRLRGDLEAIIAKAVEKEGRLRYPSAAEMAADLERYLDGRPVLARPVTPRIRLVKWARRRPARALAACVAILLVSVASLSGITWGVGVLAAVRGVESAVGDGDLARIERDLLRVPAWAGGLLFDGPSAGAVRALRDGEPDVPIVRVLRELETSSREDAWLLAARFLERDGLGAHPVLAGFLLESLAGSGGFTAPDPAGLQMVARLFLERPDSDPQASAVSARYRTRLAGLLRDEVGHEARFHVLTALGGCGNDASVAAILDWVRGLPAPDAGIEVVEEARLAAWALDFIVRRAEACGYVAGLTDDLRRDLLVLAAERSAGYVLHDVFGVVARLERDAGFAATDVPAYPASNWTPAGIRAFRGDPKIRARMDATPESFLGAWDAGDERAPLMNLREIGITLEALGSDLESPAARAIHGAATERGLDPRVARHWMEIGVGFARAYAGLTELHLPDRDTHLAVGLSQDELPVTVIERSGPPESLPDGVVAVWDFLQRPPALAGLAVRSVLTATPLLSDEERLDQGFARLGNGGNSRIDLDFTLPAVQARDLRLEILLSPAKRRAVPYSGVGSVTVSQDGRFVARYVATPTQEGPVVFGLSALHLGSGRHSVSVSLDPLSTTTVRVERIELSRP